MAVVSGRLQMREWQDREGNKRISAEVVADNVYFGEGKKGREGGEGDYHPPARSGYDGTKPSGPAFHEIDEADGELPF
jgi:single-strand DNA-binding protein